MGRPQLPPSKKAASKGYSLYQRHERFIAREAERLTREKGVPISDSLALQLMLDALAAGQPWGK